MKKKIIVTIFVFLSLTIMSHFALSKANFKLSKDADITDISQGISQGHKNHPDAKHCGQFNLNGKQVTKFLKHAKVITGRQFQHDYDWSPCFVEGHLTQNNQSILWKILASKKGLIQFESGEAVLLYCKRCKSPPFFDF